MGVCTLRSSSPLPLCTLLWTYLLPSFPGPCHDAALGPCHSVVPLLAHTLTLAWVIASLSLSIPVLQLPSSSLSPPSSFPSLGGASDLCTALRFLAQPYCCSSARGWTQAGAPAIKGEWRSLCLRGMSGLFLLRLVWVLARCVVSSSMWTVSGISSDVEGELGLRVLPGCLKCVGKLCRL
ncbi:hypothetical protein GOP47_0023993 [Adiantum capillus-veneris]|uniref:Uncharacterized protein n=1 Tax=Adiantum capillus-veneris TaxID=13818 RepID=A0A9D4U5R6_ADICA|nr:hypothetical protein GOP47_0023993 [Adiantum capillus-veneris]